MSEEIKVCGIALTYVASEERKFRDLYFCNGSPEILMVRDSDDDGATFRWELSFQLLGVAISRYSELETAAQAAAFLEGEVEWKMRGLASFLNWIGRNQP